mmetsp:Transcript_18037/g.42150  ORF Transcript_18037/g.42150 Transcript_18037/m.42150 type:complete len:119 (+) Transcript_18037:1310-1666(+)
MPISQQPSSESKGASGGTSAPGTVGHRTSLATAAAHGRLWVNATAAATTGTSCAKSVVTHGHQDTLGKVFHKHAANVRLRVSPSRLSSCRTVQCAVQGAVLMTARVAVCVARLASIAA